MDGLHEALKHTEESIREIENGRTHSIDYLAGFARAVLEVQGMALTAIELENTMKAYNVPYANLAAEAMCAATNHIADRLFTIWEDLTNEES